MPKPVYMTISNRPLSLSSKDRESVQAVVVVDNRKQTRDDYSSPYADVTRREEYQMDGYSCNW